jgi:predicted PurR-regulated permease PerM
LIYNNFIYPAAKKHRRALMTNFNWNRRHTVIAVAVAVYAVLAILLAIIINNRAIVSWINGTLSVIAPIIIGAAIAYICSPIMRLFEDKLFRQIKSRRIKRVLSVICTYLVILLGITAILLIIIPQLQRSYKDFIANLNSYTTQAIAYVNRIIAQFDFSLSNDQIGEYISIEDIQAKISEWFRDTSTLFSNISSYVINYGASLVSGVMNLLLGLFISVYILSSKERLGAQARMLCAAIMNRERYDSLMKWCRFTNITFGRYIKATLLDSLIIGIISGIAFSIAGLPYPILLAFIVGITNVIPVFGPFIGAIPAGFIVLIASPGKLILFIILILVIQQLDGNILQPKLVGMTTGMTSFGVLCAIIIMGGYFGILGMILGVPVFIVLGEMIRQAIHRRLIKKDLSVSLADYYLSGSSVIDTEEEKRRVSLTARLFNWLKKIFRKIFKKDKKGKDNNIDTDKTNTD